METYWKLSVEQSVLLDGRVALSDPGQFVARPTLAVYATVEHWSVWISCKI